MRRLAARNIENTLHLYCNTEKAKPDSYYWVVDVQKDKVLEEGIINNKIESYWDSVLKRCDTEGNFIK